MILFNTEILLHTTLNVFERLFETKLTEYLEKNSDKYVDIETHEVAAYCFQIHLKDNYYTHNTIVISGDNGLYEVYFIDDNEIDLNEMDFEYKTIDDIPVL